MLNAHGGDLPRYRGNACQAWAILNGEDRIDICIHRMVPDVLDSGDIIAPAYLPIFSNTKIKNIYEWFEEIIPQLFSSTLGKIFSDFDFTLETQSKVASGIVRYFPRRPEDGEVDWSVSTDKIVRLINASERPFIGAYSTLEDTCVHFFTSLEVKEVEKYYAVPGQILRINEASKSVDVTTARETIRLSEMKNSQGTDPNFLETFRSVQQRFIKNKTVSVETIYIVYCGQSYVPHTRKAGACLTLVITHSGLFYSELDPLHLEFIFLGITLKVFSSSVAL